jgi:hypothetical protein
MEFTSFPKEKVFASQMCAPGSPEEAKTSAFPLWGEGKEIFTSAGRFGPALCAGRLLSTAKRIDY